MNNGHAKALRLPVSVERRDAGGSFHIVVAFEDPAINPWTLGLLLLRQELIRRLKVLGSSGRTLLIDLDRGIPPQERATARWDGHALSLTVGKVELEYWIDFFLRYFRDRQGAVPHLDIDASVSKSERLDIIFKVEHAGPAMSPEDLKRLLEN